MRLESPRLAVVDAGRIDPHGLDRALASQRAASGPGKVQLRDRARTKLVGAEIAPPLRPIPSEAGAQEHDGAIQAAPLFRFPVLQIIELDLVIAVPQAPIARIHDHARPDEPLEWDLLERCPGLVEVDGGIDVSPAVLGGLEAMRGIVIARLGVTFEALDELESNPSSVGQ